MASSEIPSLPRPQASDFFLPTHLKGSRFAFREFDVERDLLDVHRIFRQGFEFYADPLPETSPVKKFIEKYIVSSIEDDLARIDEVYVKPGGAFFVAADTQSDGRVVGCVAVEKKSDTAVELRRMSVDPEVRGQGLGLSLVRMAEEFAALGGFETLFLSTGTNMAPAVALYHRAGFEAHEIKWWPIEAVEAANEQAGHVAFRKPITSNSGRWVWSSFEPHPSLATPPTIEKQSHRAEQPPTPSTYRVRKELAVGSSFVLRSIDMEKDVPLVHAIFEEGMRHYCDPLPESVLKRLWNDYIANALATDMAKIDDVYLKPGGDFFVIENSQSQRLVGIVGAEKLSDDRCELRRMAVSPEVRRSGLGTTLVRQVEEFAAMRGFKELMLSTGSVMNPAIEFYARLGFENNKVVDHYDAESAEQLAQAGEKFQIVFFRKPITSNHGRWTWERFEPARRD